MVQNGATSAVGRAVIQICKYRGINTINIVRGNKKDQDGNNIDYLIKEDLLSIGATEVITEDEARSRDFIKNMFDSNKSLKKPVLGLNCVGGSSSATLLKLLAKKGSLVTYGGIYILILIHTYLYL